MTHDKPLFQEYLSQVISTDFQFLETKTNRVADTVSQRIKLKIDQDDVETSAFGIIYVIGLLSFIQAVPAGSSVIEYNEEDMWTVEDFLRRLSYQRGKLLFHADYVRGRLMKTTVEISHDGTVEIEAVNRGELPTQWADYLLGKKRLLDFLDEKNLGPVH